MNEILDYCTKEAHTLGQIYATCKVAYPELKQLVKGLVISEFLDPVEPDYTPAFKGKHLYEFKTKDEPKPILHKFSLKDYHYSTTILGKNILRYQSNIAKLDKAANDFNAQAFARAGVPEEEIPSLLDPNTLLVMRVPQQQSLTTT